MIPGATASYPFVSRWRLTSRSADRPVIRPRNFDPETRTLRKHADDDQMDTIEKNVEGLAEKIIAEDAERRQQELASRL